LVTCSFLSVVPVARQIANDYRLTGAWAQRLLIAAIRED
jgi:hypothetical protein